MSAPGPITAQLNAFQSETLKLHSKVQNDNEGQFRTFWLNRMSYYEQNLKKLAETYQAQHSKLNILKISALPTSILEMKDETTGNLIKSSQKVILFGLFKRHPDQFLEDIFKLKESKHEIEDLAAGCWFPTVETLDRVNKIDQKSYTYTHQDKIYFEDFSDVNDTHEIFLKGKILFESDKFITTGLPGIVVGKFDPENAVFDVESFEILKNYGQGGSADGILEANDEMADEETSSSPQPKRVPGKKLLVLRDLNLGETDNFELEFSKLQNFLAQIALGFYENVTHLVILGGLFSKNAWKFSGQNASKDPEVNLLQLASILYNKKTYTASGVGVKQDNILDNLQIQKYLEIVDDFLCNLCEMLPVTVFPGEYDFVYKSAPKFGLHRELFPKACLYKNLRVCNLSISDMVFADSENPSQKCQVLGVSDTMKIQNFKTEILLQGLENFDLRPGAPYPEFVDFWFTRQARSENGTENSPDPFLLTEKPDLILLNDDSNFSGSVKNSNLFVQSVPKFPDVITFDLGKFESEYFEN